MVIRNINEYVACPFAIVVDSREQLPYAFQDIRSNKDEGNKIYDIRTISQCLDVGDYTVQGLTDKIIIERKSKQDLYQSILKRENFIGRLKKMEQFPYSAVIVEDDLEGIASRPPKFGKLSPLTVTRTIISWDHKYKTKWWLVRGRRMAEKLTFRLLYQCWKDYNEKPSRGPRRYDFK